MNAFPTSQSDQRMVRIRTALQAALQPVTCDLQDESALHAGHAGAASGGGHYRLRIVSEYFTGLTRVKRHRLVYDCLLSMMATEIHALAIEALTPAESGHLAGST